MVLSSIPAYLHVMLDRGYDWWRDLDIAARLASIASIVVFCGLLVVGVVAAAQIEDGIVHRSAAATALYMDSFVEGHVQELSSGRALLPENREALEKLLAPAAIGRPIVSFRIWVDDTIVFSNRRDLIGRTFAPGTSRNQARRGSLVARFGQLDDEDDAQERAMHLPMLEVYAPVHATGTGRIIAVAETYEIAIALREEVRAAQLFCWLLLAATAAAIIYFLLSIAQRGARERGTLQGKIVELAEINAENQSFRTRFSDVNNRAAEIHERSLRRFGSELHNGPMQLVSLALLKLDYLHELVTRPDLAAKTRAEEFDAIREALDQSLDKIRKLSASLGPPEMEELALADVMKSVARRHVRRTGAQLELEVQNLPSAVAFPIKACLYRFAGEALELSLAGASDEVQELRAVCASGTIKVEVSGWANPTDAGKSAVQDLRDRVEAQGGQFKATARDDRGMLFSASFNNPSMMSKNG